MSNEHHSVVEKLISEHGLEMTQRYIMMQLREATARMQALTMIEKELESGQANVLVPAATPKKAGQS